MIASIAEQARTTVLDCLYRAEEAPAGGPPPSDAVIVEGVTIVFGFHPGRLESKRADVVALLRRLPPEFRVEPGQSFLNACMTADGEQWGEHANVQELLALAIGLKLARWTFPREVWHALPGGMPLVVLTLPEGL